jgi:hypothetical protein
MIKNAPTSRKTNGQTQPGADIKLPPSHISSIKQQKNEPYIDDIGLVFALQIIISPYPIV